MKGFCKIYLVQIESTDDQVFIDKELKKLPQEYTEMMEFVLEH